MKKLTASISIFFAISVAQTFSSPAYPSSNSPLDPSNPEDAVKIYRKIACNSFDDTVHRFEYYSGPVFGQRPGEAARHLFDIYGSSVRRCETVSHETRGVGFQARSNVITLFVNPDTGEVLEDWTNPYTGERISSKPSILQNSADQPVYPIGPNGTPFKIDIEAQPHLSYIRWQLIGGEVGEYPPPGTVDFNTRILPTEDLFDRNRTELSKFQVAWTRVEPWRKWMNMGTSDGQLFWHITATPVPSTNDFPQVLLKILQDRYPEFLTPPL